MPKWKLRSRELTQFHSFTDIRGMYPRSHRMILLFAILIAVYFYGFYLIFLSGARPVLLGVLTEILTLPMIAGQVMLLAFITIHLFLHRKENKKLLVISGIIWLATTLLLLKDTIFP